MKIKAATQWAALGLVSVLSLSAQSAFAAGKLDVKNFRANVEVNNVSVINGTGIQAAQIGLASVNTNGDASIKNFRSEVSANNILVSNSGSLQGVQLGLGSINHSIIPGIK